MAGAGAVPGGHGAGSGAGGQRPASRPQGASARGARPSHLSPFVAFTSLARALHVRGIVAVQWSGFRSTAPEATAMKVAEIMNTDVFLTAPHRTIREAAETMQRMDVGSLPVGD